MAIPDPDADSTKKLIDTIAPDGELTWVSVEPVEGAVELECIDVVEDVVKKHGGRMILGWALWEWPGVLVEGEFHAVWEKPSGELVDPTPKPDGESKILFLPDSKAEIDTYQKDNIRMPHRHRREILDFIEIKERIFRAMNRGDEANTRYYTHTPHLDFLHQEEAKIFAKLVKKFGEPPK